MHVNLHSERNRLPAHERTAVSDEELRIASQISDDEFIDRMRIFKPHYNERQERAGVIHECST